MSISLKLELETWDAALKAYDEENFEHALNLFSFMADSSKILTNMGLIYATVGRHDIAVEYFAAATNLDSHLAIAHFQCGVSNFLMQRYDLALLNFEDAYLHLRGNEAIYYEQIGLNFKLYSVEVLFNRGLAQLHLGFPEDGMADLQQASSQKVTDEHGVIDEAIRNRGEGYTVFSIPVGVLYRPSENKIKNAKTKDYLGKAKLVAASDSNDAFTEFTGVKRLKQASTENLGNDSNREGANEPDAQTSARNTSVSEPVSRAEPIEGDVVTLKRSKTGPQLTSATRPSTAAILASRRAQSVSNPANVPSLHPLLSPPARSNNGGLGEYNAGRLARNGQASIAPLKVKPPQGAAGLVANLQKPELQGTSPVAQLSTPQPPPLSLHPGQGINSEQALLLPPAAARGGHLTQFYDAYMDVYADDATSAPRSTGVHAVTRPPAATSAFSPLPQQPLEQETQQGHQQLYQQQQQRQAAWSAIRTSKPGHSKTRSESSLMPTWRGGREGMTTAQTSLGAGMARRQQSMRRPVMTTRRATTVYEDDEGDDVSVTGEYDEYEMANIRVKLHYQDDVRGMTIPLTTTFDAFVERVTTKFGTALTGLGMKFVDEDGTKISLRDESDFELAVETARESAGGRSEGKMEVWCLDV